MTEKAKDARAKALPSTSRSLPIALIRARERVMVPVRRMLAASNVTEQQWRVLRVLEEYGPTDSTALSERSSLLLSSLTRIVRTLVRKGYVTRAPDSADRRRSMVAITAAGRKLIRDNTPRVLEIAASFEAAVGKENFRRLLDLLDGLERGMREQKVRSGEGNGPDASSHRR